MAPRPTKKQTAAAPKAVHPVKPTDGASDNSMLVAHLQDQLDEVSLSFETVNELLGKRTNEVFTANKEQKRAERDRDRLEKALEQAREEVAALKAELRTFKPEEEDESEAAPIAQPAGRMAQLPPDPRAKP